MTRFIMTYTWKNLWFRWNCYGLFYSGRINTVLFYSMILSLVSTYSMMSYFLDGQEMEQMWHNFFTTNGFKNVASSVMVYYFLGNTRNAGLATIWMVHSGIGFFVSMLGLEHYFLPFDFAIKCLMTFIAFHILIDIYYRSNAKRGKIHHKLRHRGYA